MIAITSATIGIEPYSQYSICSDGIGGIYVLQPSEFEDIALVSYSTGLDNWNIQQIEFDALEHFPFDNLALEATSDGSVWILGSDKLYRLKNGDIQVFNLSSPTNPYGRFIQLAVNDNNIWLLHSRNGLYYFDRNVNLPIHINDPTDQAYEYGQVIADSDNNVWLTKEYYAENLIGLMSDGTWQLVNDPDSLLACTTCNEWMNHHKIMWEAIGDLEGSVYLFLGGGFYRIHDRTLELMSPIHITGGVGAMLIDNQNELWMHSASRNNYPNTYLNPFVYHYEGNTTPTYFDVSQLFDGNVWLYDSSVDKNNNIWVGTNKGLVVYNADGVRL